VAAAHGGAVVLAGTGRPEGETGHVQRRHVAEAMAKVVAATVGDDG
jgi:hypothetical protein